MTGVLVRSGTGTHKEDDAETPEEDDPLQAKKRWWGQVLPHGLRWNQPCQHLNLRLPASTIETTNSRCLSLWHCVMAAPANEYSSISCYFSVQDTQISVKSSSSCPGPHGPDPICTCNSSASLELQLSSSLMGPSPPLLFHTSDSKYDCALHPRKFLPGR